MVTHALSFITFLAAFLLFEIEFIIAKIFLPAYGGSFFVWGACIVFFQAVLLLGYGFAHRFIGWLGLKRYLYGHALLLVLPLLVFPGRELKSLVVNPSLPLVVDVFWKLAISIGPVFFVLSTMSIVTQVWMSQTRADIRVNPYRLYAVSNLGSFIALFSYPFLIEYQMDISSQLMFWRYCYFLLVVLNCAAVFMIPVTEGAVRSKNDSPVKKEKVLRWVFLGAGGSMMFLSVSNLITFELPPVPLFWIFPLSIYLLSFVLNFKKEPWCPRWMVTQIAPILGLSALFYFLIQKYELPPLLEFSLFLGILFCICMYCQNRLIEAKPSNEGDLTGFYFLISMGSFLGAIATTWIIPLVSVSMVEYLCALLLISLATLNDGARPVFSARALRVVIYLNLLYYVWSAMFVSFNVLAVGILIFLSWKTYQYLGGFRYGVVACLLLLFIFSPAQDYMWDRKSTENTWRLRNYYGIHEVVDSSDVRWLYHGRTVHGGQYLSKEKQHQPITYYGPHSGIWDLMKIQGQAVRKAAIIGLGTGSMASYFDENQSLDIFELDPDVLRIAHEKFTFLKHNRSPKRFFIGDARLSMQAFGRQDYDVIVIDAFGGDAIPVHLITKEVFKEYQSHLRPGGGILVHVSNRYVNLIPVIANVADSLGAAMTFKISQSRGEHLVTSSWILISWNRELIQKISQTEGWRGMEAVLWEGRTWTDQYSSILPFMRLDYLLSSLKTFRLFSWELF
ncbi:MAG: fused MFS/spermidine synthase [Candidatus Omnitrophica bacterium]|nr:fused MFS/spermidine synthase [Candidatus Omnitrophota bacterium]